MKSFRRFVIVISALSLTLQAGPVFAGNGGSKGGGSTTTNGNGSSTGVGTGKGSSNGNGNGGTNGGGNGDQGYGNTHAGGGTDNGSGNKGLNNGHGNNGGGNSGGGNSGGGSTGVGTGNGSSNGGGNGGTNNGGNNDQGYGNTHGGGGTDNGGGNDGLNNGKHGGGDPTPHPTETHGGGNPGGGDPTPHPTETHGGGNPGGGDPTPHPTETHGGGNPGGGDPTPTPTVTQTQNPDPNPNPTPTVTQTQNPNPNPTQTQTQNPEPTPTPTQAQKKAKLHFDLAPVLWLTPDFSNALINQGGSSKMLRDGKTISIVKDDARAGYRQMKSSSLDIDLGLGGGWHFQNATTLAMRLFGMGGGIVPNKGSTTISERFVSSPEAARKMKDRGLPTRAAYLSDWRKGDSVSYQSRGGVAFSAFGGFAGVGAALSYVAEGNWTTYVEKLDGNSVYVKLTNASLNTLTAYAGAVVANVSKSFFNGNEDRLSFVFDLNDSDAAEAYEAMLRGSLFEAEKMADDHNGGVERDETAKAKSRGNISQFSIGLPILLNYSSSSGEVTSLSDTVHHSDNSKSHVEYGKYTKESHSNVIFRHQSQSKTFYGVAYSNVDANGSRLDGEFGKMVLSYENDHSSANTITKAVKSMVKQTGLRDELRVSVPRASGKQGYTHVSLTVVIPEEATNSIVHARMSAKTQDDVGNMVDNYFKGLGDPEKYCDPDQVTDVQDCRAEVRAQTISAVKDMRAAVAKMAASRSTSNKTAFTKAYAELGKASLKNEFTFTLLKNLAQTPLEINFEAEGAKISKAQVELETAASATSLDSTLP